MTRMLSLVPRLAVLAAPCALAAAAFPYIPVTALLSANATTVYVFRPGSGSGASSSDSFELVAINTTSSVSSSELASTTISSPLPFSADDGDNNNGTSFNVVMDHRGEIHAFAGDCSGDPQSSAVWTFTPGGDAAAGGGGTWRKKGITLRGSARSRPLGASNYLAGGLAFSGTAGASPELYIFGGMCPNASGPTAQSWQASANYSNAMLSLRDPSTPGTSTDWDLEPVASRGPPIAEAGMTITPLPPTYFNATGGGDAMQQNFILLGGHTRQAFINMSQAALFSLPEQSWTFLPVEGPDPSVDPRSGHTAVLTEDGRRIVVFGGWVGDVSAPAEPQLAVLELGAGYGGAGYGGAGYGGAERWRWTIPSVQGTPPSGNGTGMYGHGAVLLPGGVMMITGGRSTSDAVAKRAGPPGDRAYFFNTTSNAWAPTYQNPASVGGGPGAAATAAAAEGGGLSRAQKIGLGTGLGIGLALLLVAALAALFLRYRRRARRRRTAVYSGERPDQGMDAQRLQGPAAGEAWPRPEMLQRNRTAVDFYPWSPDFEPGPADHGWRNMRQSEAERTGLLVEIPSPTRGLRRSLHSRGAAPWHEDRRQSRASGGIHPIDERDEYEEAGERAAKHHVADGGTETMTAAAATRDPFMDPLGSHPVPFESRSPSPQSPQSPEEREREVQGWISDWTTAAEQQRTQQHQQQHQHQHQQQAGRASPDRTERTASTLSEKSMHSAISYLSAGQPSSGGGLSRSASQRSTAVFSASNAARSSTTPSTLLDWRSSLVSSPRQGHRRSKSLTLDPSTRRSGGPTTATAMTATAATPTPTPTTGRPISFLQLQAEGEALLSGGGAGPSTAGNESPTHHGRRRSLLGSVRRALNRRGSTSQGARDAGAPSPTEEAEARLAGGTSPPRRAASTGAMPWRRRQGARDWEAEHAAGSTGPSPSPETAGEDDEDWDVESAVERRVVQVMFTVPREKLRVVNGTPDPDGESVRSVAGIVEEVGEEEEDEEGGWMGGLGQEEDQYTGKGKGRDTDTDRDRDRDRAGGRRFTALTGADDEGPSASPRSLEMG